MIDVSNLPELKAVILDMDGLLLDTEAGYFVAWQQAALAMGFELSEAFCRSLSGMHYSMLKKKLLAYCEGNLDLSTFHQYSSVCWRQHVEQHGIPLQTGFHYLFDAINELKLPYRLATNSPLVNARECLQLAGVADYFPELISRDDVQQGKPSPEIFFKAANSLDVDIKSCWVVEDSLTGVQAANRSGAFSVCIPSVLPVDDEIKRLASLQLNDLSELSKIIRDKFAL